MINHRQSVDELTYIRLITSNTDGIAATSSPGDPKPTAPTTTILATSPFSAPPLRHHNCQSHRHLLPEMQQMWASNWTGLWIYEYNLEIKQTLSLHVVNSFTFRANVFCSKFNYYGRYIAVELENGETHIHNMTTGSKRLIIYFVLLVISTDPRFIISIAVEHSAAIFLH